MGFFDGVALAEKDPILSLNAEFFEDSRSNKVNLGLGVYKNSELKPMLLSSVRKAENILALKNLERGYLPIDGDPQFLRLSSELLFGRDSQRLSSGHVYAAQSLGGTGALRLGADFLFSEVGNRVYISDPTWINHKPIFIYAGHEIAYYPYYHKKSCNFDFENMCSAIKEMPKGSVILLHGCCHNPTGIDPTLEQWKEIASLIRKQQVFPFFDVAYQGFGEGLDKDAQVVRYFADEGLEMFVSYSCSKTFGLYGERTGVFFVVAKDESVVEKVASKTKSLIRTNYSSPPAHGARIVKTILSSDELREEWRTELRNMRERVFEMRKALVSGLLAKSQDRDFSFMRDQRGMFSFSGLTKEHVDQLIVEYGIYMPGDGRINVAGLSSENLDYVVDAILSV